MKSILNSQKFIALISLVVLWVFFALNGQNFVSGSTCLNILASSYYVGFLALGITFVIITGGIDLSIGAVMMCSALIGAECYRDFNVPLWICLLIIIGVATLFGLINGLLVTKFKLTPFIATLGTMMVALGLGSIVTDTTSKYFPIATEPDGWFVNYFYKTEGDFPVGAIYLLVFYLIAILVLNRTKIGRYVFAIGSNEEATRLSGVNVDFYKTLVYVIGGFFVGLGAILYGATYTVVIPNTGNGIELMAIAGAIIGGTSLNGGEGSLTGTIIGVFIMAVIKNGLVSMGLPASYQVLFTGIVVICAVLLDISRNRERNPKKKSYVIWIIGAIIICIFGCSLYGFFNRNKATNETKLYIPVIGNGYEVPFWQAVSKGVDKAGKDLGVDVYFTGPKGDCSLADQTDLINQELAKGPDAICMSPVDMEGVKPIIKEANEKGIPVLIFDYEVKKVDGCEIVGNVATNNRKVAGIGAEHMFDGIKDHILAANKNHQVYIGIVIENMTSSCTIYRTEGFVDKFIKLLKKNKKEYAVIGDYSKRNQGNEENADVVIEIVCCPTPNITAVSNVCNKVLQRSNLYGFFCINESVVLGLLSTLNAGAKPPKDCLLVGYDAGKTQKAAIREGIFYGSISQDPVKMGYESVKAAKEAVDGKKDIFVDTGGFWYDKNNVDDPKLKDILYD